MEKRKVSPLVLILGLSFGFFITFVLLSSVLWFRFSHEGGDTGNKKVALFDKKNKIGILEVEGPIMDSKKYLAGLDEFEEDDSVAGILVRLNSPGGAVGPSQEVYNRIKKSKKPIVASMGSLAASGAFYIAMGAPTIFANPGTLTGSIGVIMQFMNLEKLFDWAKVKPYVIKTGKFKDVGSQSREMSAEERELLQNMIDEVLVQFKQAIADSRKLSMEDVTKIADGRIFAGSKAKELKLIDELGGFDEAVEFLATKAGIKGKPDIVYPEKKRHGFIDFFMNQSDDSESRSGSSFSAKSIVGAIANEVSGVSSGVRLEPGIYWLWAPN